MARKFKLKVAINKFWIRLHTTWWILNSRKSHWVLMSIDKKNLIKLIEEENIEVNIKHHGLVEYNIQMMCKFIADRKDDIDYVLDKAAYEAAAIERARNNKER